MRLRNIGIVPAVSVLMVLASTAAAFAGKTITSGGPLTNVTVTSDLNCALNRVGDTKRE